MFVVCGEALWDLFGVESENGLRFDARIGGSPFNVALGLARLRQPVALFTGVSTDPLGERLLAVLRGEGVRCDLLKRSDRPTTLSVVTLSPEGRPAYAFYGENAADRALAVADLPTLGPDVRGVHAGSYSLVVEPVGTALLALFAREKGRRLLTVDPNVRLSVEPDVRVWIDRIERVVALADVVKASDEDLGLLYPGATGEEVATAWLRAGAGLVVVTRGAAGAEAFAAAGRVAIPGRPVAVTDTVGAGDSFQAALIAGLAERGVRTRGDLDAMPRGDIAAVASFATAAAAITCSRRGADMPRRGELPTTIGEPA